MKAEPKVFILPSAVVTVRSLVPIVAPAVTVTLAVIELALIVVVVAETPVPEKDTDEPLVNLDPVIVTAIESP